MNVLELLDRPIAFQRAFVRLGVGITGALMLSQALYWTKRSSGRDGWFYKTQADWEDETGMTRFEQETARKKLRDLGILEEKKQGIPCKTHYRVNLESLQTRLLESRRQCRGNPADSAEEIQQAITETTTETTTEESAKTKKRFSPPSVADVRLYCIERKNGIDAEAFVDHYNSNGWMVGRNRMKDWRAAVRQWERRQSDYNRAQSASQSPARPGSYQGVEI